MRDSKDGEELEKLESEHRFRIESAHLTAPDSYEELMKILQRQL